MMGLEVFRFPDPVLNRENIMHLKEYFIGQTGTGILATVSDSGEVDTAIYAKPHFMEDGTIAFIMRDRLTHSNLRNNPRANYMFVEHSQGYRGVRLFLKKVDESDDNEVIGSLTRRRLSPEEDKARGKKFLVSFTVEKILPLIGSEKVVIH